MTEAHESGEISGRETATARTKPQHIEFWIADNWQITGNGGKRQKKEHKLQTGRAKPGGRPKAIISLVELARAQTEASIKTLVALRDSAFP